MKIFTNWCLSVWRYFVCLFVVGSILASMVFVMNLPIRCRKEQKAYTPVFEQVNFSGTFMKGIRYTPSRTAVSRPWSEVVNWSKEAFLSYHVSMGSMYCLAWAPNPEKEGGFLKSEAFFSTPKDWNILTECKTSFNPKTGELKMTPIMMSRRDFACYFIIASIISACVGILLSILFSKCWLVVFHPWHAWYPLERLGLPE